MFDSPFGALSVVVVFAILFVWGFVSWLVAIPIATLRWLFNPRRGWKYYYTEVFLIVMQIVLQLLAPGTLRRLFYNIRNIAHL